MFHLFQKNPNTAFFSFTNKPETKKNRTISAHGPTHERDIHLPEFYDAAAIKCPQQNSTRQGIGNHPLGCRSMATVPGWTSPSSSHRLRRAFRITAARAWTRACVLAKKTTHRFGKALGHKAS